MNKQTLLRKTRLLLLFIMAIAGEQVYAQRALPLENGYYVVVSTFKDTQSKEAKSYSDQLAKKGLQPGFGLEESKHFIYVYLQSFAYGQFKQSVERMQLARSKENFPTAW